MAMTRSTAARRGLMLKVCVAWLASLGAASAAFATEGVSYRIVAGEGGVPLNVATAGDPAKPAILLVHGIGQSHVSFEQQLRAPQQLVPAPGCWWSGASPMSARSCSKRF